MAARFKRVRALPNPAVSAYLQGLLLTGARFTSSCGQNALARDPRLQDLGLPDVVGVDRERVPVDQDKVGPFAGLERAEHVFLVLGVCRVEGERAQGLAGSEGLVRLLPMLAIS